MSGVIEATASTSVAAPAVAAEVTEAPANENQLTPSEELFQAIKLGADADTIIEKMTVSNPKELLESRDQQGHTLAHWAAKRGEPWLLRFLLDKGASVAAASDDDVGMRPLHWACTEGRMACARLLVDRGADVNVRDKQGCTPLVVAAQWGQADAAAYLIKVGADPRIFDRHDDSALHWAAYKGNVEIVGLLHHLGLPLDDADAYGQTPLHLAALRGNLGVCEYLLVDAATTTKTRLDPVDRNSKRPVDLAIEKNHQHVRRFLDGQRPVCERGLKAFLRDNMSLGACITSCIAGEKARFPWCAMVLNKLLAQTLYVFLFLNAEFSPSSGNSGHGFDVPVWVHASVINLHVVVWASFLLCWLGDPGVIKDTKAEGKLRDAYDAYFDRLVTGERDDDAVPIKLDHSCHIVRPLRSKHCRVSRQCVVGFDHYCPYVGTTVGLQNYRWFYLYCVSFTLAAIQWQCVAISYIKTYTVSYLFYGAMVWFALFILFGLAMVAYHTQLVFSNVTTNEHQNMARYEHFRDSNGIVRNPFDAGVWQNVCDRFLPPRVDDLPVVHHSFADAGAKAPLLAKA